MKKLVYLSTIALAAVCCTKKFDEQAVKTILVPVTAEAGMETKTVMDVRDGASYIDFAAGDQIGIWDGQAVMPLTTAEGGARAIFTGDLNMDEGGEPLTSTYYAVSPYKEGMTYSDGKFDITIPHNQVPTVNGFDPAAQFGYGSSSAGNLSFNFSNAVSFAKIVVNTESQINLLGILSTDGATLAGSLKMNPVNGDLSDGASTEAWSSVQFNTALANGTYYLALRPGNYHIELYAETTSGEKYYRKSGDIAFAANQIRYLVNLTENSLSPIQQGEIMHAGESLDVGSYMVIAATGSGTIEITRNGNKYTITQKGAAGTAVYNTYDIKLIDAGDNKVFAILYDGAGKAYAYLRMLGNRLNCYSPSTAEKERIAEIGWTAFLESLNDTDIPIWETHDGVRVKVYYHCTTKFSVYKIN